MSKEWKEVCLGDVCTIRRGSSPRPIVDYFTDSGMPWVKIADATSSESKFISQTKHFLKESGISSSVIVEPGDLIMSNSGTAGLAKFMGIKACIHDGWQVFKNLDGITGDFLYYSLIFMRSRLLHGANDSTMKNLTLDMVREAKIRLPEITEQLAITKVLGSIDNKIDLIRQMNQTLEAMAQALFKSWFVDFGPVMDNALAAGNPIPDELLVMAEKRQLVKDSKKLISTNPELAAKFPSSFVFNETLGKWIPEGWEVKKIGECDIYISDFVANGSFASLKENVTLYPEEKEYALFMRNTDLKSGFVKKVYVDKHSYDFLRKSKLLGGEVIISNVGDVGSVYRCPDLDIPMTLGNNVILLNSHFNNFLYHFFIGTLGQALIDGIKGGSAQPKFNKTDFKSQSILIPSKVTLDEFERLDSLNRAKLESSIKNVETLIELRDRLLPELISGRVRVNYFEKTKTHE